MQYMRVLNSSMYSCLDLELNGLSVMGNKGRRLIESFVIKLPWVNGQLISHSANFQLFCNVLSQLQFGDRKNRTLLRDQGKGRSSPDTESTING